MKNHAFPRKWHQIARKASKRMIGCRRMSYLCCANGKDRASEQPGMTVRPNLMATPDGAWARRRMRQRERHTQVNHKSLKTSNGNMSESRKKETVKTVLQFIVSVLTALLATLGVQSCSCI